MVYRGPLAEQQGWDSSRGEKILTFIVSFTVNNGFPPAMTEIIAATGLKSKSGAYYWLSKLEREGRITRQYKLARAIRVTGL